MALHVLIQFVGFQLFCWLDPYSFLLPTLVARQSLAQPQLHYLEVEPMVNLLLWGTTNDWLKKHCLMRDCPGLLELGDHRCWLEMTGTQR